MPNYGSSISYPDNTEEIIPFDGLSTVSLYIEHFNTTYIYVNNNIVEYAAGCDSDYQVPYSFVVRRDDRIVFKRAGGRESNIYMRLFRMG